MGIREWRLLVLHVELLFRQGRVAFGPFDIWRRVISKNAFCYQLQIYSSYISQINVLQIIKRYTKASSRVKAVCFLLFSGCLFARFGIRELRTLNITPFDHAGVKSRNSGAEYGLIPRSKSSLITPAFHYCYLSCCSVSASEGAATT
jgi:hypothetical protein